MLSFSVSFFVKVSSKSNWKQISIHALAPSIDYTLSKMRVSEASGLDSMSCRSISITLLLMKFRFSSRISICSLTYRISLESWKGSKTSYYLCWAMINLPNCSYKPSISASTSWNSESFFSLCYCNSENSTIRWVLSTIHALIWSKSTCFSC